jgi:hypothetical protein
VGVYDFLGFLFFMGYNEVGLNEVAGYHTVKKTRHKEKQSDANYEK